MENASAKNQWKSYLLARLFRYLMTRTRLLLSPQDSLSTLFPRSILLLNCESERNFVGVRERLSTCHKITNCFKQLLLCLRFINRKTNSKRKPFFKTQSETINYIIQQQYKSKTNVFCRVFHFDMSFPELPSQRTREALPTFAHLLMNAATHILNSVTKWRAALASLLRHQMGSFRL